MASNEDERLEAISERWNNSRKKSRTHPLGTGVDAFMKRWVTQRHKRLAQLAEAWRELLPDDMVEHSCFQDLQRGQLTVLVDTAGHLSELNLMVKEGLIEELRDMCPTVSVTRIKLRRGVWYHSNKEGMRIADY